MKNINFLTFMAISLLTTPAIAQNPYAKDDNSWISINGRVNTVSADEFELDYGDGEITVEMDDGDRDADGYKLLPGDEVRVSGLIDDSFFQTTTIDATSVYVKNIDTYFYASAIDDEYYGYDVISSRTTDTFIEGTITSMSVDDEQFTLDTGLQMLTVEVDELLSNPLDNEGYQQLEVGERVRVNGQIDYDFFQGRVFEADYVTNI